jgi:hypothetical protein
VVWRDAHQGGLVVGRAHELDGRNDVGGEVPVAKDGGFRLAGRAARKQENRDVLRVGEPDLGRAFPAREIETVGASHELNTLDVLHPAYRVRLDDRHRGSRAGQHVAEPVVR